MNKQKLLTIPEAKSKVRLAGLNYRTIADDVTEWANAQGADLPKPISRALVQKFFGGKFKGHYGNAPGSRCISASSRCSRIASRWKPRRSSG